MNLLKTLWTDEAGVILSAETVLLGTVGVLGATVGLSAASKSIDGELTDFARAMRSLDQSYHVEGVRHGTAWTAGSSFKQAPVEESLKALDADIQADQAELDKAEKAKAKPEEPKKKKKPKKETTVSVEETL
jgi:hypothetical protein